MSEEVEAQLREALKNLLVLLAQKKYAEAVAACDEGQLSAGDLQEIIASYGVTLTEPPENFWTKVDMVQLNEDVSPIPRWHVVCSLWTVEENGMSDLSLELYASCPNGQIRLELLDLHVL